MMVCLTLFHGITSPISNTQPDIDLISFGLSAKSVPIHNNFKIPIFTINKHEIFSTLDIFQNFLSSFPVIHPLICTEASKNTSCVSYIKPRANLCVHHAFSCRSQGICFISLCQDHSQDTMILKTCPPLTIRASPLEQPFMLNHLRT